MSERGHFRGGGRGAPRGARGGQDRGGRGGASQSNQQTEKPKKENILDLTKYMHKEVQVKFNGGREGMSTKLLSWLVLTGCSRGNLGRLRSIDESSTRPRQGDNERQVHFSQRITLTRHADDEGNETTRDLGLVVARGTLLVLISPVDGSEEIENPFAQPAEE